MGNTDSKKGGWKNEMRYPYALRIARTHPKVDGGDR